MARRTPSIAHTRAGPDGRAGFEVRTPFDRVWLEQLKAMVPARDRRFWEDRDSAWWVAEKHRDVVQHLTLECFGEIDLIDAEGVVDTVTRDGQRIRQESLL